jgi:predicted metal-binding membrane protein
MEMAVSMAAMMAPTAAPFFVAFGRDTKRPVAIAAVVLIYVAAWALIGAAAGALMGRVMMPGGPLVVGAALPFALIYTLMPWSRRARERCREMCRHEARGPAVREATTYAASCVACSAGVMVALVVLGMSNVLLLAAAAAVMLVYKLI